jgi:hypothetical protein
LRGFIFIFGEARQVVDWHGKAGLGKAGIGKARKLAFFKKAFF